MRSAIARLALLLAALLAGGCSTTPAVDTDYNENYDFSAAKAFAIVEPERASDSAALASDDILHNRIIGAIRAALGARGFRVVEPAQADMLVSFLITTENRTEVHEYNAGVGYYGCWRCGSLFAGTDIDVDQYTEGTLFVDFIDRDSRQLQWRGAVTQRLSRSRSFEERKKLVDEIVAGIVAKFPPGK